MDEPVGRPALPLAHRQTRRHPAIALPVHPDHAAHRLVLPRPVLRPVVGQIVAERPDRKVWVVSDERDGGRAELLLRHEDKGRKKGDHKAILSEQ